MLRSQPMIQWEIIEVLVSIIPFKLMFQTSGFLVNGYVYRYFSSCLMPCLYSVREFIIDLQLLASISLPHETEPLWLRSCMCVIPLCKAKALTMPSN